MRKREHEIDVTRLEFRVAGETKKNLKKYQRQEKNGMFMDNEKQH